MSAKNVRRGGWYLRLISFPKDGLPFDVIFPCCRLPQGDKVVVIDHCPDQLRSGRMTGQSRSISSERPPCLNRRRTLSKLACVRLATQQRGKHLSRKLLVGDGSLRRALNQYLPHYHEERNHQGKGNLLLFPKAAPSSREQPVQCRERLGGLLRYYHREAA